jgi:ribosomal protein L10
LNEANVNDLAKLGSIEEVRASFIGILKGAQSNFVRVLSAPEMGLANLKTQ